MAIVTKPPALDESINTTEGTSRNIADVLAQELSNIATSISGGSDKVPKTDIATVEPTNVASRAYNIGELVYVNGNLYKVITAISGGATFTVGTNIQSTNVSNRIKENEYKAGDVITLTPKDYMFGLIVGTQIYVNLPLNKPISATSASLTVTSPSLSIATVQGQKDATYVRVVSVSIANSSLQINIDTNVSTVDVSPIALGMNGTITFS